jgi:hypothetical protein
MAIKYINRCLTSLPINKRKSKWLWDSISPWTEWLPSRKQTGNAGKDVRKKQTLYTIGWNVN